MDNFKLKFTFNAAGRKGSLSAVITSNIDGKRNARVIKAISIKDEGSFNGKDKDPRFQRFILGSKSKCNLDEVNAANNILNRLCDRFEIIKDMPLGDGSQMLDRLFSKDSFGNNEYTLLTFIDEIIADEQKKSSGNWKNYKILRNVIDGTHSKQVKKNKYEIVNAATVPRLNGVRIADIPISDVDNLVLAAFSRFIINERDNKNFDMLCSRLKSVVSKSIEQGLNKNIITFRYQSMAIQKNHDMNNVKTIHTLTSEQFAELEKYDVSKFPTSPLRNRYDTNELLFDTALLMYYTFSRPIDVMNLRHDRIFTTKNINGENVRVWRYIPCKLAGHNRVVEVPLNDKALAIINKYQGVSTAGYVLPLSCNMNVRDMNNKNDYNNYLNQINAIQHRINVLLKKFIPILGLDFNLTLYSFRRSVISHAIFEHNCNESLVADYAGTSLEKIAKHYKRNTTNTVIQL